MNCKQFRIDLFALTVCAFVLPRFLHNEVSSVLFDYKQKAVKSMKQKKWTNNSTLAARVEIMDTSTARLVRTSVKADMDLLLAIINLSFIYDHATIYQD